MYRTINQIWTQSCSPSHTQVYSMTNTLPYSFVHSRQPPSPSLLSTIAYETPGETDYHSTKLMRKLLLNLVVALRAKIYANMRQYQSRYKLEDDPRTSKVPSFTPGTYVFVDSPTLRAVSNAFAKAMEKHT